MDAHRVWADIDLDALSHNLSVLRECAERGATRRAIMLVVKADAYGHGAVAIAHRAIQAGVEALGVGTSAEALELRQAGIVAPILILGTILEEEAPAAMARDIHFGIHSADRCQLLEKLGKRMGRVAQVHLNVDTGIGRLGVLPERALDILQMIERSEHLRLAGVMTHMSSSEGWRNAHTQAQMDLFAGVLESASQKGIDTGWVHSTNSVALFSEQEADSALQEQAKFLSGSARQSGSFRPQPDPRGNLVRPGIAAYGILPPGTPGAERLQPVLSLKSSVVFLKDLPAGASVGYNQTWSAPAEARIATLPVGYNDGVHLSLSNRGCVLIRGTRAPVVGSVSMDYLTVDVTHIPGVSSGDEVTLVGSQGDAVISLDDVADWANTIPHEITCAVGKRVTRICRSRDAFGPPTQTKLQGRAQSPTDAALTKSPRRATDGATQQALPTSGAS